MMVSADILAGISGLFTRKDDIKQPPAESLSAMVRWGSLDYPCKPRQGMECTYDVEYSRISSYVRAHIIWIVIGFLLIGK